MMMMIMLWLPVTTTASQVRLKATSNSLGKYPPVFQVAASQVKMETKSTAFSVAVPFPELLDKHNYATWAIRVRTYLEGQDLWEDIINDNENATALHEDDDEDAIKVRRRRNSMALHVIQTSCGPDAFSEISTIRSADTAWQTLKTKYLLDKGNIDNSYLNFADLYKAVLRGKLKAAKEFLDSQPEAVRKALTDKSETALHIAVTAGHDGIVKELVDRMTKEDLGIEDGDGCTALMKAVEYGRSELARYLYIRTPLKDLAPAEKDKKGAMLLTRAIYSRNLEFALHLICTYPRLTYVLDDRGESPFLALASMRHAFQSGNRLSFWKQWIYSRLSIDQSARSTYETPLNNPNDVENGRQRNILVTRQSGATIEIYMNIPNVENGLQRNQVTMLGSVPALVVL